MTAPIDLFGGLKVDKRTNSAGRTVGARMVVDFTAPEFFFHADDKAIATEVAEAIAETIGGNLVQGKAPDGTPLPMASEATLERRRYRIDQDIRGGQLNERITDRRARVRGVRGWARRFRAAKLGDQHPVAGATLFGSESGLLARSVVAVVEGAGFRVFFAALRAKLDRTGENAVLRVFRRIDIWNRQAMTQPRVQEALRNVQKNLWAKSAAAALAQARTAASNLMAFSEDLEDEG